MTTWFISGSSRGFGRQWATAALERGARVAATARDTGTLADLVEQYGDAVLPLRLDVTDRDAAVAAVQAAHERFGRLDVLVNNAGLMPLSLLRDRKVDEWDRMVDVNLRGTLYGVAAALPVFDAQQAGHFVNVSSVADRGVFPTAAVYCATKFAVRALSEGLRLEAGRHVRVTLVAPGATESELAEGISDPELRRAAVAEFRRDLLPADAIARAVAFAVAQPADVDVNEIVVRPTAQAY